MNTYWWLAIAAVMAIAEAFSLSLVTIWFVAGALAAFLAGMLGADMMIQIVVFLAVSVVCLVLLRPLIMKHRKIGESHEATPIGLNAVVVERIDHDALSGRVETPDHMTWAAMSADGNPIEEGAQVRVVEQQSIKLIVERI